jgi:hypothetical protein
MGVPVLIKYNQIEPISLTQSVVTYISLHSVQLRLLGEGASAIFYSRVGSADDLSRFCGGCLLQMNLKYCVLTNSKTKKTIFHLLYWHEIWSLALTKTDAL